MSTVKKSFSKICKSAGFTLIEMAMVTMIIGILIAALAPVYSTYQKNKQVEETQKDITTIVSAIGDFRSINGRYPCPASLTFDKNNPNYGREDCSNHFAIAVGSCSNGICIEQSKRAPIAYQYPSGTNRNQSPRVEVGFVPFRNLNLDEKQAYDAYGNRMMYVATEHLTCDNCFQPTGGGIDIIDDSGTTALPAVGTAHFLVFSYGANNAGAYQISGDRIGCAATGNDSENCDFDRSAADADATYMMALTGTANNNSNFDDQLNYFTQTEVPLWQTSSAQQFSIHQKPGGNVGLRLAMVGEKNDVAGIARAQPDTDPVITYPTGAVYSNRLCDTDNANCFRPVAISGNLSDPIGGMKCPEDDTFDDDGNGSPETGPLMLGVTNSRPICGNQVRTECVDANGNVSFMMGVNADGSLKCAAVTPPKKPCVATDVNLLCPPDPNKNSLPNAAHGTQVTIKAGDNRQRVYTCNDGTWDPKDPTGSCKCTPSVVGGTKGCDPNYQGGYTTSVETFCPAGNKVTTIVGGSCVCQGSSKPGSRGCPKGWTGAIATVTVTKCVNGKPVTDPTTDVPGGNTCKCTDKKEPKTENCPENLTGSGIKYERDIKCVANGIEEGSWKEISRDCKCTEIEKTENFSCPTGLVGSIKKKRKLKCPGATWSDWEEVSNDCKVPPPVYCSWKPISTGVESTFRDGTNDTQNNCDCNAGKAKCYTRNGANSYTNYSKCQCE